MERTYSFTCPLTDRLMYEDMEYSSNRTETTKQETMITHSGEQEKVMRPAKKAKAKAKAIGGLEVLEKPFTVNHKQLLAKMQESYAKNCSELEHQIAEVETDGLSIYMPKHLVDKQSNFLAAMRVESAELAVQIETGEGDMKVLKIKFSETKGKFKDLEGRCRTAMDEAAEAKTEHAPAHGGAWVHFT